MVGYYYKTGNEIYDILAFMKNRLNLEYKSSPGSLKIGETYRSKQYRFSFFLNERKEIVYLIEPMIDDNTDYSEEKSKEGDTMTKGEALLKIEELKAFVEKLDSEIPEMPDDENSNATAFLGLYKYDALHTYRDCTFEAKDTRDCYLIKALELAHLMYARECLKLSVTGEDIYSTTVTGTRIDYNACWKLYFDKNACEYQLSHHNIVKSMEDSVDPWMFRDKENALKAKNYMNKYVKDRVKELY